MARYPYSYGIAYPDHHYYPKGFLLLSLDRRVEDKVYIDNRIMLEVLDIGQKFAVIEFNFWERPLPLKLNPLPTPDAQRVRACKIGRFMRIAPGVGLIVAEILNPFSRVKIQLEAPRGIRIDRGEIRQKRHLKVA